MILRQSFLMLTTLFLTMAFSADQSQLSYPDWEKSMSENQKKEQAAKEKIAEEQAKIKTCKDQLKQTKKQEEIARADILSIAGTTSEAVGEWQAQIHALLAKVEAFNSAQAQDKIQRQSEVPAFEAEVAALKQDRAALLLSGQAQVAVLDKAVESSKTGVVQAQKDIAAAESAAKLAAMDEKKRKVEEARLAKEEAKRKAEEERQAKLEAKRQAAEEAQRAAEEARQAKAAEKEKAAEEARQKAEETRQKAEAEKAVREQAKAEAAAALPAASDDLKPGIIYKVKENPADCESLSKMAVRLYGDKTLWTKIYEANKAKIDNAFAAHKRKYPNSNFKEPQDFIYPGMDLIIPQ